MKQLTQNEIDQVSGGSFNILGNALIGAAALANNILNTPLISSVGQVFSAIGGPLTVIHQAADSTGYAASLATVSLGKALGGTGSVTYHYEKERAESLYYF